MLVFDVLFMSEAFDEQLDQQAYLPRRLLLPCWPYDKDPRRSDGVTRQDRNKRSGR